MTYFVFIFFLLFFYKQFNFQKNKIKNNILFRSFSLLMYQLHSLKQKNENKIEQTLFLISE
jgi:hypothetical protein